MTQEQVDNTDNAEAELQDSWNTWERTEPEHHDMTLASQEFGATALYAIATALIEIAVQGRENEDERWKKEHEELRQFLNMPPLMESNDAIQAILEFTDIVALIGEYVELERTGSDHRGPCPFHGGKHRNFAVIPKRQMYYCFVCREGGNAVHFLMKQLKLSKSDALQKLRERRDGIADMEPIDHD